ncbi:hypothetical protein PHLCEN_2v12049 [Hermanssonia centrifuga]|uniref:CHAT domain-containing protein n=1 Tax=Hermanssonia centrifuga TaxID=98765 RepID=A0A2R6NII4_9APHY|nr:hypothetical protein PHLCEN_2v12049 [Hermanssonia centrifuga]
MKHKKLLGTLYTAFDKSSPQGIIQKGKPKRKLESEISTSRLALDRLSYDDPQQWHSLFHLGQLLYVRFEQLRVHRDLDEAISLHLSALHFRPLGHVDRFNSLYRLSIYTQTRYQLNNLVEDLEAAIDYGTEAEELARAINHPYLTWAHYCIAGVKLHDNTIPSSCETTAPSNTTAEIRFASARLLADAGRKRGHTSALRAYKLALVLVERCLTTRFTISRQRSFLISDDVRTLSSTAASCAIEIGDLASAVEVLEQGRGLVWSQVRDNRYPLENLPDVAPELTEAFRETLVQLELLSMSSDDVRVSSEEKAAYKSHLLERWNDTLQKIRELPGFQDFLRPRPLNSLRMAAAEGPVIITNLDTLRSDAIIMQSTGPLSLVPLSTDLPRLLSGLSKIMDRISEQGRADRPWQYPGGPAQTLTSILQSLWRYVCSPVVEKLLAMGIPEGSRIWWCPTKNLSSMPLHAAGPYTDTGKNLPDIFLSSYAPTLASLIRARVSLADGTMIRGVRLLAVGQSQGLSQVKVELEHLKELFAARAMIRDGYDASPTTILDDILIREHSFIHFACHGYVNGTLPFESYFVLHKDKLFLRQIMEAYVPHAELAFLASCYSAVGDSEQSPDEPISLTAAMQVAGYRCVVGTLWTMFDEDGPRLSKDFYGYLLRGGIENVDFRESAMALHLAVRGMRERGIPVERWSTFVHIGI